MADEKNKTAKSAGTTGGGVLTTLGIVFIVLKLTHNIDWSWWWVTVPFWGPIAAAMVFVTVMVSLAVIVGTYEAWKKEP